MPMIGMRGGSSNRGFGAYGKGYNNATGGTITTYSSGGKNYRVHTFTGNGTFVMSSSIDPCNYLVVAGGYGGGNDYNGNGGPGGGWSANTGTIAAGTYSVTVGGGGSVGNPGNPGGSSTFNGITTNSGAGAGGGGAYGQPDPGQGYPGGTGLSNSWRTGSNEYYGSGGGGGGGINGSVGSMTGGYGSGGAGACWSYTCGGWGGTAGIVVIRYEIA